MKQIPRMQSDDRELNQLQVNILSVLNPILKTMPILFGTTLQSVQLKVGNNFVTTGLSNPIQGWVIIRKRGPANIYDNQDNNTSPQTLLLVSDAAVSIDLIIF